MLDNSLLIRPSEIRASLDVAGEPDGTHRIIYDDARAHVCSEPEALTTSDPNDLANRVLNHVKENREPLSLQLRRIYEGLDDRSPIRRKRDEDIDGYPEGADAFLVSNPRVSRARPEMVREERRRRLAALAERAKTDEDAMAAALGFEFWTLGIQLILASTRDS